MATSPLVLTRWNLVKYGNKYIRDNSLKLCFGSKHKLRAYIPKTSIHHDFDWYIHPQNPYILKVRYDVESYLDINYLFSYENEYTYLYFEKNFLYTGPDYRFAFDNKELLFESELKDNDQIVAIQDARL